MIRLLSKRSPKDNLTMKFQLPAKFGQIVSSMSTGYEISTNIRFQCFQIDHDSDLCDSNGTRTRNHLVRKRTLNHLA